jgi:hypothetical protein
MFDHATIRVAEGRRRSAGFTWREAAFVLDPGGHDVEVVDHLR